MEEEFGPTGFSRFFSDEEYYKWLVKKVDGNLHNAKMYHKVAVWKWSSSSV
jgi:hypothetical protein